ncbi:ROK family transcriptional regulator [Streptomyces sp. NPDC006458]|uniref:ROK family transcriptional regulator n=1 Tax=Streptomyces sp. NPDC006458 TaxID=3154302 RepID=UPI0033B00347
MRIGGSTGEGGSGRHGRASSRGSGGEGEAVAARGTAPMRGIGAARTLGPGRRVTASRAAGSGRSAGGSRSAAGANLPDLRSHNTALVLGLLRAAGADGISRLELAERTGLTPQAVSKITARLRTDGLAEEAGRRASTGGKPRTVLRLVPGAGHALGVHLDRDELRAVLVDLAGEVVAERRAPLDLGAGSEVVLDAVGREAEVLLREAGPFPGAGRSPAEEADLPPGLLSHARTLFGLGVALPGPLDHIHGVLHRVTGFPEWDGFPLRDVLAERLGVPVVVDKDTNAAALGLSVAGAGGSFAYLHLGTGLGAGLVIGGVVHRGARTGAGEFGHQVLALDGPPCTCGNRGCVEALCLAAVARGEVAEAARVLGVGAANLVGLLDIDAVLLGGRTVDSAPGAFVLGVGEVLAAHAHRASDQDTPVPVLIAPNGMRGVAEGAAQLLLAPLFGRGER